MSEKEKNVRAILDSHEQAIFKLREENRMLRELILDLGGRLDSLVKKLPAVSPSVCWKVTNKD